MSVRILESICLLGIGTLEITRLDNVGASTIRTGELGTWTLGVSR